MAIRIGVSNQILRYISALRYARQPKITPVMNKMGYAFVGEPQTNGVIERLFRTLKEQIVYGRIFQTVDDVRDAVRAFAARYNAEWLIEKNGHRSPDDARAAWHDHPFRRAA